METTPPPVIINDTPLRRPVGGSDMIFAKYPSLQNGDYPLKHPSLLLGLALVPQLTFDDHDKT